jgi:hypothetical protein
MRSIYTIQPPIECFCIFLPSVQPELSVGDSNHSLVDHSVVRVRVVSWLQLGFLNTNVKGYP